MALARHVRGHSAAGDVAGVCQPGRSVGVRAVARAVVCRPKPSTIAPRSATPSDGASGGEREYPWGSAPPEEPHGHFDFQGWEPVPVGSRPAGASAWGVHDLVGNGWEWTSTIFGPFPGFSPMASYPEVLGRLLRRPALRDEGRLAGDGTGAPAPQLPQLVQAELSVRVRDVQDGGAMTADPIPKSCPSHES